MSPEELKREQEALENITRWTGDHIVEIFPHKHRRQLDANGDSSLNDGPSAYEAFLSQIPGDKSTKSLKVYPTPRPGSQASGSSTRSKLSSSKLNGSVRGKDSRVFVKLDVDLT